MKAIVIKPGKFARVKDLDLSYHTLRTLVGGNIEMTYPFEDEEFIEAFRNVNKVDIDAGVTSFSTFSREGAFAKALGYLFDEYLDSRTGMLA